MIPWSGSSLTCAEDTHLWGWREGSMQDMRNKQSADISDPCCAHLCSILPCNQNNRIKNIPLYIIYMFYYCSYIEILLLKSILTFDWTWSLHASLVWKCLPQVTQAKCSDGLPLRWIAGSQGEWSNLHTSCCAQYLYNTCMYQNKSDLKKQKKMCCYKYQWDYLFRCPSRRGMLS